MKQETRTVVYDDALRIEAYRFKGMLLACIAGE